jgi:AraC family transcriptional regulator
LKKKGMSRKRSVRRRFGGGAGAPRLVQFGHRFAHRDQGGFRTATTIKRLRPAISYSEPRGDEVSLTIRALWYIESHLSGELALEAIADDLGVSRFHLSRAFSAAVGLPLAVYVRARRLSEAAKTLAQGAPEIVAVALDAGYGSHEAFTRAFRQRFGLTPEQLRAQGHFDNLNLLEPIRMEPTTNLKLGAPRIVKSEALLILGLGERYHCESKAGIPSQWDRFLPHFGHIPGQVGSVAGVR